MANYTVAINVNVPIEVKNQANEIFNKLGLNMSTAINMFLKIVIIIILKMYLLKKYMLYMILTKN